MVHRPEHDPPIDPGCGRPHPRDVVTGLWLAITSRGQAAHWVRYRVLAMLLSMVVLAWSVGRTVAMAVAEPGGGFAGRLPVVEATEAAADGEVTTAGGTLEPDGLRTDLFKVPRAARPAPPPEPKTNPVELLALIELQGVLGGSRPRAMIQYKRTHEAVTVSVGDDLGEFKVMEIGERSVVLKWRDELFELSL